MTKTETIKSPPALRSAADVRSDQEAQVQEQASAQAELERLRAGRPGMLLTVSDDELDWHDAAMRKAERAIERAVARQASLVLELEVAAAREDQVERVRRYEAARQALAGLVLIETQHAELVRLGRAMVRNLALIDEAIDAANAALPDGFERLPRAEAFRSPEGTAREVISAVELQLWVQDNGWPLPDAEQGNVRPQPDGQGWLSGDYITNDKNPDGSAKKRLLKRRTFVDVVYDEATRPHGLVPFARDLNIPALRPTDPVGWRALEDPRPHRVLSTLASIDDKPAVAPAARPRSERKRVTLEIYERDFGRRPGATID